MAVRAASPAFFHPLPSIRSEREIAPRAESASRENPIGVFRGLAFALIFQLLAAAVGFAGWEILHRLF